MRSADLSTTLTTYIFWRLLQNGGQNEFFANRRACKSQRQDDIPGQCTISGIFCHFYILSFYRHQSAGRDHLRSRWLAGGAARMDRHLYQRGSGAFQARWAQKLKADDRPLRSWYPGDGDRHNYEVQRAGICNLRYWGADHWYRWVTAASRSQGPPHPDDRRFHHLWLRRRRKRRRPVT